MCGLAAKAALFVPLHGLPPCQNVAKIPHADVISRIAAWQPDIAAASRRFGVPEHWIKAVMRVESDGHLTMNGRPIRSSAGAMGLMQVMPQIYAELRIRYNLGANPYAPRDNIMAGTAYLREMFDRFGASWFLAAYNAGPARLEQTLLTGRGLPVQTQRYLAAVVPMINRTTETPQMIASRALVSMFTYRAATEFRQKVRPASSAEDGLFVAGGQPINQEASSGSTP
ncbi:lytic transglycosylase domain-containing protein [Acidiphilium sp. 34-64-41]|nr:lytic transglycosylase domain-containing protein [Acidiphilium sp. 34-64-41]OZB27492.1 MAG: hypothetical protein B7X49_10880 [Acidiphilium sp. 34-64-41]